MTRLAHRIRTLLSPRKPSRRRERLSPEKARLLRENLRALLTSKEHLAKRSETAA
jgi:hypothetical protein